MLDFLNPSSTYVEGQYRRFCADPSSVPRDWAAFFAGVEWAGRHQHDVDGSSGVYGLVYAYRHHGYRIAQIDPLGHGRTELPLLELSEFDLQGAASDAQVGRGPFRGETDGTLADVITKLRTTYCGEVGIEYMGISDREQQQWLQERMEPTLNDPGFSVEEQRGIHRSLVEAEEFERFLHTKYVGQKRFSIEGADSLLPLLDTLVEHGTSLGMAEFVLAMSHRGRLNVLAHVVHKPLEVIFSEFEGTALAEDALWNSDVKYHLGYSNHTVTRRGKPAYLTLMYNPSHLELVNPIIEGSVQARQDYRGDVERKQIMPIVIHGEAAFTGQGIVPETLALSEIPGYHTGGTLHVIVNNQVAFTANPEETRFTQYPTDIAQMIEAPVFHVNADAPEAVCLAARLAIEFRLRFRSDVFLDLWSYRRHGHNESDDPTFTQPVMYRQISEHATARARYESELIETGALDETEASEVADEVRAKLRDAHALALSSSPQEPKLTLGGRWSGYTADDDDGSEPDTGVAIETLQTIAAHACESPPGFHIHRTIARLMTQRREMIEGCRPVDWGCAEMLSLGSLLLDGTAVRLAGQDSGRGTFSHRHAVWSDIETGQRYIPLQHLAEAQARLQVINTMLSELAVLGFEYGITTADPARLVIWEAQFGDFANGAQPIIDQFISSAEAKWLRLSGLVMLLPHGYEGQGPEHSSARLERFLSLCAEDNLQVCVPSTAAQYFHLLRRQVRRSARKPLIIMTPKSLLRLATAGSDISELTGGGFQTVIDDSGGTPGARVQRLLLCSGKIFHELADERARRGADDVHILRLEQLYPVPYERLQLLIARYPAAAEIVWVQEEPRNMGAWGFISPELRRLLGSGREPRCVSRDESATSATGSNTVHRREQDAILDAALESGNESVLEAS